MHEYTEIIKATEVDGQPVSVHLDADAPAWLLDEATAWVQKIADHDSPAPEPAPPYKSGDRIVATQDGGRFYREGDIAVLLRKESDGDWLADFLQPENKVVRGDGKWWIEECHFTLAAPEPEPDVFEEAMRELRFQRSFESAVKAIGPTVAALRALDRRVRRLEEGR
jgi:hypothetical protein